MQNHAEIEVEHVAPTRMDRIRGFVHTMKASPLVHYATCGVIMTFAGATKLVRWAARAILFTVAWIRLPAAAFLAGLLSVSVVSFGLSTLWRSAQGALVSLDFCKIPVVCSVLDVASFNVCDLPWVPVAFPYCSTSVPLPGRADFPRLLAIQHHAFDELIAGSSTNSELVLNVKHAELAVRDLVVLVKASNLTAKEPLAEALSLFSVDARRTGRALQLLMSRIHGTVDRIMAYNTYALRTIESTHKASAPGDPRVDIIVLRTFQTSMASFSASIASIIVEATSVSTDLDLLEERLSTIHALCEHEAFDTALAKDELLWQLWTLLGRNRRQLRELAHRASILQSVEQYRALASAYIAATVHSLTVVDADLTELREQLGTQAVGSDILPVEVQVRGLEGSLSRLKESSVGGKGLEGEVGRSLASSGEAH
ncbi:hypothetical protein GSI_12596 [Ganoderma sinense ZZ0214-1]|uniref:Uncharacterized protein n=1 Tax=Ganoderma sinense ZZ0214-1 TaxID=1077348 RepID=A0A2G8RT79_9APHY|nr:hypothetical protein GSI_12596 [Ganoderma sinense ZZ0214-1]